MPRPPGRCSSGIEPSSVGEWAATDTRWPPWPGSSGSPGTRHRRRARPRTTTCRPRVPAANAHRHRHRRDLVPGRLAGPPASGQLDHLPGSPHANAVHPTVLVTGFVDLDRHRLIDVVPGRSAAAVSTWLGAKPPRWLAGIATAVIDPYSGS